MVWSPRAYAAPGGTGVSAFRFRAFRFSQIVVLQLCRACGAGTGTGGNWLNTG